MIYHWWKLFGMGLPTNKQGIGRSTEDSEAGLKMWFHGTVLDQHTHSPGHVLHTAAYKTKQK